MARPLRIEYPGAFYHVTSRGNEQKDVFKSQRDREKFLEYLESSTERYGAVVHAYCLMSNHFHLVLETPQANLVAGMQWFLSTLHREVQPAASAVRPPCAVAVTNG